MAKKKQDNKPIKITRSTKLNRFEIGQRVRLELRPLSEYVWTDGEPDLVLNTEDFAILANGSTDEGTIVDVWEDDLVDGWAGRVLEVRSDKTGCVHVWTLEHLRTVTILGMASAREIPADYLLTLSDGSERTIRFDGKALATVMSSIPWGVIRWLAGAMGVGPSCRLDGADFSNLGYSVSFVQYDEDEVTVNVGCWEIHEHEVREFLSWAMARAPEESSEASGEDEE